MLPGRLPGLLWWPRCPSQEQLPLSAPCSSASLNQGLSGILGIWLGQGTEEVLGPRAVAPASQAQGKGVARQG